MSGTNHKQSGAASLDVDDLFQFDSPAYGRSGDAAWFGRGRVRARIVGSMVLLGIAAATSQARVFKSLVGDFLRREARSLRPDVASDFEVVIRIEVGPDAPRLDVDNVAKAVLDALTGAVFRDDSQVSRLLVERRPGATSRIWVAAAPRA